MHNEHDRDVIEQVKILKEQRKLNALIYRLLREHFESERQLLISDLTEKYEVLGLGDTPTRHKVPFVYPCLITFALSADVPRTNMLTERVSTSELT